MVLEKIVERVPWTARRSNQSILKEIREGKTKVHGSKLIGDQSVLKEINPEESLEGLMLRLQHLGHLM